MSTRLTMQPADFFSQGSAAWDKPVIEGGGLPDDSIDYPFLQQIPLYCRGGISAPGIQLLRQRFGALI